MKTIEMTMPNVNTPTNLLANFTDAQLEKELERRRTPVKPEASVSVTNFEGLRSFVIREAVPYLETKGHWPKDFKHLCYELTIEAVYGPDFWTWLVWFQKQFEKASP